MDNKLMRDGWMDNKLMKGGWMIWMLVGPQKKRQARKPLAALLELALTRL